MLQGSVGKFLETHFGGEINNASVLNSFEGISLVIVHCLG